MSNRFWITTAVLFGVISWFLAPACEATERTEPPTTAIVAVHGGGWYGGTPAKMDRVCQVVAPALGFDCFQPSYTLSGEGSHAQQFRDLKGFIEGLRGEGYDRIIGIGASAGGNLVGTLASHGQLDAAVTLSAPTNLVSLDDWFRTQCDCWVIDQFAPTPEKKIGASPALDEITVPILILHAADEALIPRAQARKLAEASTQETLVILPTDAHAMSYFDDVADDITDWIGALP